MNKHKFGYDIHENVPEGTCVGRGLKTGKHNNNSLDIVKLVRSLQKLEGHAACFKTDRAFVCDEKDCVWRVYCLEKENITHE